MNKPSKKRVIALGTFDGLHPGHRAVIETCVALAREKGVSALVYTFWENPKALFGRAPLCLMSPAEKLSGIVALGADEVAADHFDEALRSLPAESFIDSIVERFSPVAFVCGADYSFGAGGEGNSKLLTKLANERGIETRIVPTVRVLTENGYSDEKVSSTLIRDALARGDSETAGKLLRGDAI
ncbi:MAG: FAD synthetase family protein [Clostridia bacterium]|nr:FAD synthetase family protein [Clostridia bacterium]